MEVSFDVLKEHLIDFSLYNIKHSKQLQKMISIQTFITPLIFLAFGIVIGFIKNNLTQWLVTSLVIYTAWVIIYPRWYKRAVKKNIIQDIEKNVGDKELIGHCKLILTDDGVTEESNARTVTINYNNLVRVVETKEYVFVFNSENSSYVIPKGKFKSESYEREYLDILSSKSGKQIEYWD